MSVYLHAVVVAALATFLLVGTCNTDATLPPGGAFPIFEFR